MPKLLSGSPPLVLQTVRRLRAGLGDDVPLLAVVRPDTVALHELLITEGVTVTVCPDADTGMGASLAHAARQVSDTDPVLVALGDMPAIAETTLQAVCHALEIGASLVQPQWQGQRGHPVGFHPRWLPALRTLAGDTGARGLLSSHADQLMLLPVEDPGIVQDVDTPADLAALGTSQGLAPRPA